MNLYIAINIQTHHKLRSPFVMSTAYAFFTVLFSNCGTIAVYTFWLFLRHYVVWNTNQLPLIKAQGLHTLYTIDSCNNFIEWDPKYHLGLVIGIDVVMIVVTFKLLICTFQEENKFFNVLRWNNRISNELRAKELLKR